MNLFKTNGQVPPSAVSVTYLNFQPGNNWGVLTNTYYFGRSVPIAVIDNPIVDAHVERPRNRRKAMSDAAKEFAASNRDLLRELAR